MLIHLLAQTQKHVSVPRVGQIEKVVSCERCNCRYGYVVYRRAIGSGTYSIWGRKDKAVHSANSKAESQVQKLLERAIEPVPCPGCGWMQSEMVREMRRRFARWMIGAGVVALVVFLMTAGVIYLSEVDNRRPMGAGTRTLIEDAIVLAIGLGAGAIAARYALTFLIDPNGMYRADRPAIPGAPIGYPMGDRAAASQSARQPLADESPGRATVQLAVVRFPAQCCRCMTETSSTKPIRCGTSSQINLPVCPSCMSGEKIAKILVIVGGAVVGLVAGCAGGFYLPPGNNEFFLPLAAGAALTGAVLGLLIARRVRCAKFSRFSSDRNVVRIDFKNHQYAALLREKGRLV